MEQTPQPKESSTPAFTPLYGTLILAATIMGSGMVSLDATIVTVALPQIQRDFQSSMSGLQWLIDVYLLFLTVPILVAGSLSDRYGRRKLFNLGLVGFTLASAVCGLAGSLDQLILARIVQGISGAIMLPGSLAILNASFPPQVRGKTVGTWSAFTPLATAIGPLLGGWLVDNVSWRAAFLINLPVGLATLLLSLRFIPESKSESMPGSQDWLGAGLVMAGLGSLVFGLIEGPRRGWGDGLVLASLLGGLAGLGLFLLVEWKSRHPMIPLGLFKHRLFAGVTAITFVLYFAMSGVFFFLTLNLQQIQGFSATMAGAAFMPVIIFIFLLSRRAGKFADRHGPRWPMILGPAIIGVGFFVYMIPGREANYWLTFLPATVIFGVGLGITMAPLTVVALAAVPTHMSGLASGISNAVARVATMLAVAMLGALMIGQFGMSLQFETRLLPLSPQDRLVLQQEKVDLGGAEPPAHLPAGVQDQVSRAIDQAFVDAFRLMMGLCALLALASAALALVTISQRITQAGESKVTWRKSDLKTSRGEMGGL